MTRSEHDRIADIIIAIDYCITYRPYLDGNDDIVRQMAFDAVTAQLVTVGEAANHLSDETRNALSGIRWSEIIGLRNILVHQYFGIDPSVITSVLDDNLAVLREDLIAFVGRTALGDQS